MTTVCCSSQTRPRSRQARSASPIGRVGLATAAQRVHEPAASTRAAPGLQPDRAAELWAQFDEEVRDLGAALEGVSSVRIAPVFDTLSESLRELSYANRPEESLRQRRAG
jgi:hypothetical protein